MNIVQLTDAQFEMLKGQLNEEGQEVLAKNTFDRNSFTRYSCNASAECGGMYEDDENGQWLFRPDVIGYKTSNLFKASFKSMSVYIPADTLEEATAKAADRFRLQKNAMHRLAVRLYERDVKVDDDGHHIKDEQAYLNSHM